MSLEEEFGKPTDYEFCPDQEQSYLALFMMLPRGRAWGTRPFTYDIDTNIKRFFHGIAKTWADFETAMCNALNEWFCFTAVDDIDGWSADYGIPDDCDLYNQSLCSKVEANAPPTTARIQQLLEDSGYIAGLRWLTGSDSQYPGVRSTLRVTVDPLLSPAYLEWTVLPFPVGRHFGEPSIASVQCMLERYIPAHTAVIVELGAQWEPVTGLGSDLIAFWHADDTADGAVSSWTDRILSIAATQAGAIRPTSSVIMSLDNTNQRFLTFNGAQYLDLATLTGLLNGTTPGEVWSVVSQDASDVLRQAFSYGGAGNYRGPNMIVTGSTPRLQAAMGSILLNDTGGADFSGFAIVGVRHDGTQLRARINGVNTIPPSLADTTLNTPATRGRIGASSDLAAAHMWSGKERFHLVTKPLSDDKMQRLEGWLAWNSGTAPALDGTHPYRTVRP